ncbi:MAG: FAD-dependent oxidoreductase, partial [Nitrososphaerales archaeon]
VGGKTVFNLSYKNLSPDYFGLGIHRHSIFQLLHEKIKSLSIPIINRFCASDIKNENNEYTLISKDNVRSGNYDLIIDASGARSVIRDKYAKVHFNRPLAYGALWAVCEDERQRIGKNILQQRVHQAKLGIGLIPIGKKPEAASKEYIAFHWSIRNKDYDKWRNTSFAKWKNEVTNLWGLTKYLVAQFNDHSDLTWAVYNDIVLKQFYTDRIVFIGDAGHSISPRLGQGANLGLVDALILSNVLRKYIDDIDEALALYNKARKHHVRFYHLASRSMSMLFQSDSVIAPMIRDLSFGVLCKIPFTHRQMLETLGGIKTGVFSKIDPGHLHKDYGLNK